MVGGRSPHTGLGGSSIFGGRKSSTRIRRATSTSTSSTCRCSACSIPTSAMTSATTWRSTTRRLLGDLLHTHPARLRRELRGRARGDRRCAGGCRRLPLRGRQGPHWARRGAAPPSRRRADRGDRARLLAERGTASRGAGFLGRRRARRRRAGSPPVHAADTAGGDGAGGRAARAGVRQRGGVPRAHRTDEPTHRAPARTPAPDLKEPPGAGRRSRPWLVSPSLRRSRLSPRPPVPSQASTRRSRGFRSPCARMGSISRRSTGSQAPARRRRFTRSSVRIIFRSAPRHAYARSHSARSGVRSSGRAS